MCDDKDLSTDRFTQAYGIPLRASQMPRLAIAQDAKLVNNK